MAVFVVERFLFVELVLCGSLSRSVCKSYISAQTLPIFESRKVPNCIYIMTSALPCSAYDNYCLSMRINFLFLFLNISSQLKL